MLIHNKTEILIALEDKVRGFNKYISSLDKQHFEAKPGDKWSAGQNLEHLIRSTKPLLLAYALPLFLLRLVFGKANRPSRSYEDLVIKYKTKLAAGGRASGPYIPPPVPYEKKEELLNKYDSVKEKLSAKIKNYREEDLDQYILPHPLLGKLTLREMLFFTIYHNQHHLDLLKARELS
ncbi:MAG TPA: DinB family protein [Chitinophagaceae bacterium]|nr:DinB family protein [Chitinophagaceae bacterium]